MFAVSARRTMAGARPKVSPPNPTIRRDNVIDMSRRWLAAQEDRRRVEAERRDGIRARLDAVRARTTVMNIAVPETDPRDLIAMVAAWHGVSVKEIMGPGRTVRVVAARLDAIVAVYRNCRCHGDVCSLANLGRMFNRDHTTILATLQKAGIR